MAVVQMTLHYLHLPKSSAKDHHRLEPAVGQNHRLARKQGRTAEEPEWELGMEGGRSGLLRKGTAEALRQGDQFWVGCCLCSRVRRDRDQLGWVLWGAGAV